MQKKQKIIATILWSALVLTMIAVVGRGMWGSDRSDPLPIYFQTPAFSLIDQDGKPFSSDQLKGHVWVAAVIFTNCPGACPMMSQKFAWLQEKVPSKNVKLVSFTVDPERDTPDALKDYSRRFNADLSRWHFLTGTKEQMLQTEADLKLTAIAATATQPIVHDEHFLLVDREGRVRGIYDRKDEEEIKQLARDAEALADL